MTPETLFVWRGTITPQNTTSPAFREVYGSRYWELCPFCAAPYADYFVDEVVGDRGFECEYRSFHCRACGFSGTSEWRPNFMSMGLIETLATLCEFDINDAQLRTEDLCAHLRTHFRSRLALTSRRFEEVVGSVYSEHGYTVRITKQTHDGGFDLVLLEHASGKRILVECKRNTEEHPVGIGTVRSLLGAMVLEGGADEAWIVTTSRFTQDAEHAVASLPDHKLRLVDAAALLKELEVFNRWLPPRPENDQLVALRALWNA